MRNNDRHRIEISAEHKAASYSMWKYSYQYLGAKLNAELQKLNSLYGSQRCWMRVGWKKLLERERPEGSQANRTWLETRWLMQLKKAAFLKAGLASCRREMPAVSSSFRTGRGISLGSLRVFLVSITLQEWKGKRLARQFWVSNLH